MPATASPTATTLLAAGNPTHAEQPAAKQKRPPGKVDRNRPANEVLTLNALLRDNAQLRRQLHAAQAESETQRAEKSRETARLGQRIAELRAELAGHATAAARFAGRLNTLQQSLPDLRERQVLARRATDAEARARALSVSLAEQESQAEHWRSRCLNLQRQLAGQQGQASELHAEDAEGAPLVGKCVLCIGRYGSATDAYRRIVEGRGGRFLQHQAEQLGDRSEIATALGIADLVVCQAASAGHRICRQLHEHCRQSGTPCIFIEEPAPSTFGRIVSAACAPTEAITLR